HLPPAHFRKGRPVGWSPALGSKIGERGVVMVNAVSSRGRCTVDGICRIQQRGGCQDAADGACRARHPGKTVRRRWPATPTSLEAHLQSVEDLLALGLGTAGVPPGVLVALVAEEARGLAVALGALAHLEAEGVPEAMGVNVDGAVVFGG